MRIEELKGKTISEARTELVKLTVSELKAVCKEHEAKGYSRATKFQLVDKVIDIAAHDMWLLKLGTCRIGRNNMWIEYADGTKEVIRGEIPANPSEVKFEAGKTYEYHGVEYKIVKRTKCYATMELKTGETVRRVFSESGLRKNSYTVYLTDPRHLLHSWPIMPGACPLNISRPDSNAPHL